MRTGRPRDFDVDDVLERALRVFWERGYEGASLTDLTDAMGINRPSLYATFGSKEELFRKVLERYTQSAATYLSESFKETTIRGVVEHILYGAADAQTEPNYPPGCLMVQAALSCGDDAVPIRDELTLRRAALQMGLQGRFEQAKTNGELTTDADPIDLARYVTTIIQGMSVQASGGAKREQLYRVVEMALQAIPFADVIQTS